MKIATWNVNSLRVRLSQLLDWLKKNSPDIVALQETKLPDEDFPQKEIELAGYQVVFSGQKTYNGVAILSKTPAKDVIKDFPTYTDPLRRILTATINDIRVINLYIPNGQSVDSEKYLYKLEWLSHLQTFLKNELATHKKVIVLGDFNIAPEEIDVHDPKAWEGQVLFSDKERKVFQAILKLGFKDCFRLHSNEKLFTWWDYRLNAFKRNLGLRIDHILVNEAFASACLSCHVDQVVRTHERPSDHAVVMAEFEV